MKPACLCSRDGLVAVAVSITTVQVPVVELLEVTVWDADEFTNDKCLGVVEIDIAEDVAKVPGGRIYKTWYLQVQNSSATCLHVSWYNPVARHLYRVFSSPPHALVRCSCQGALWHAPGMPCHACATRRRSSKRHPMWAPCDCRMCPRTRRQSMCQMPTSLSRSSGCHLTSPSEAPNIAAHGVTHSLPFKDAVELQQTLECHTARGICTLSRSSKSAVSSQEISFYCDLI